MNKVYYGNETHYNSLCHYGVKGQKWGERRYQNEDGTYTSEGMKRYGIESGERLKSGNLSSRDYINNMRSYESGQRHLQRDMAKRYRKEDRAQYKEDKKEFGRRDARIMQEARREDSQDERLNESRALRDSQREVYKKADETTDPVSLKARGKALIGAGMMASIGGNLLSTLKENSTGASYAGRILDIIGTSTMATGGVIYGYGRRAESRQTLNKNLNR